MKRELLRNLFLIFKITCNLQQFDDDIACSYLYFCWICDILWKGIALLGNIFSVCFKGLSTTPQFVTEPTSLFLKTSTKNLPPYVFLWHSCQGHTLLFLWKKKVILHHLCINKQVAGLYWPLRYSFPWFYFYVCSRQQECGKWTLRIKWVILDLLMKRPYHWVNTKIIGIKIYQIRAR